MSPLLPGDVERLADSQLAPHAIDRNRVLPEGDAALLRIEPESLEGLQRLDAVALARLLIGGRDRAAHARLHDADRDSVRTQLVDAILVIRADAVDHQIGTETFHRQRLRQP